MTSTALHGAKSGEQGRWQVNFCRQKRLPAQSRSFGPNVLPQMPLEFGSKGVMWAKKYMIHQLGNILNGL